MLIKYVQNPILFKKGYFALILLKMEKKLQDNVSAENEWVNSPRSFRTKTLDIYYNDAIKNTYTLCLDVSDLMYLFWKFPEIERSAKLLMGTVFNYFLERITSMRFTKLKEKYNHFIETYNDIHHRIPLAIIASYLGITQETLSWIKA